MIFPKWRQSLEISLHVHRSKPESKFFQAASISITEGSNELVVENRTLVFRGFDENSNSLLAITDIRADKFIQWQRKPQSQICWYFAKTREQYRVSSIVYLIGPANHQRDDKNKGIRLKVWESLSEKAKGQFVWPTPKADLLNNEVHIGNDDNNIPDTFVVLMFKPISVDYLNLTMTPQTRELHSIHKQTSQWIYNCVNP